MNKQLDLQSLITEIGRYIFWKHGWYQPRRLFQKLLILSIISLSSAITLVLAWRFQKFWQERGLLASGVAFTLTFTALRAVSFHHTDLLLGTALMNLRFNWIFELTGISLIWAAAIRQILKIQNI